MMGSTKWLVIFPLFFALLNRSITSREIRAEVWRHHVHHIFALRDAVEQLVLAKIKSKHCMYIKLFESDSFLSRCTISISIPNMKTNWDDLGYGVDYRDRHGRFHLLSDMTMDIDIRRHFIRKCGERRGSWTVATVARGRVDDHYFCNGLVLLMYLHILCVITYGMWHMHSET